MLKINVYFDWEWDYLRNFFFGQNLKENNIYNETACFYILSSFLWGDIHTYAFLQDH